MKNRLYITDLDKTLLRTDLSISDFTKDIWNDLVKNGIRLTIATARSAPKSRELLKELTLHHPLIVMDGALIVSSEGDVLMSNSLAFDETFEILGLSSKFGIDPFVIGMDNEGVERFCYSQRLNTLQNELIYQYKMDKRLQRCVNLQPLKENIKIVYIGQKEPLEQLKDHMIEKFKEKIEIKFSKDPYLDGYFLTLLHPKGDKSYALQALQKMMSVESSKLTVFGDSHNDIGMFNLASEKIAVQNALDEVKDISTYVLPHTNDQDGVAKYLQTLQKQL